jgi:hypothetical protein
MKPRRREGSRLSQAVLLLSAKTVSAFPLNTVQLLFAFAVVLASATLFLSATAQQTRSREITFPATLQWKKQTSVTRYRLQVASDEKFQDVLFDKPITGERYVVSALSPGYYYWRVAPIDSPSRVSKSVRFFVSGGVVRTVHLPNRVSRSRSGSPQHLLIPHMLSGGFIH